MSTSPPADSPLKAAEPVTTVPTSRSSGLRSTLIWVVVACLMLGGSAAVRTVQDRRYLEESTFNENCPFPLDEIPRTLGRWKSENEDQKLDSKTLLITGGKEYTIRIYGDELTGVKLVVLLLFGPVDPVIPHVPASCYPANGFTKLDQPLRRRFKFSELDASGRKVEKSAEKPSDAKEEGPTALFESAVYKKSRQIEGVYHSFRYDGNWSPYVTLGKGLGRRTRGVFKIQIQRLVAEGESRDSDKYPEPIEDFLKELLPVIEYKISQAEAKDEAKSKSVASTTPTK